MCLAISIEKMGPSIILWSPQNDKEFLCIEGMVILPLSTVSGTSSFWLHPPNDQALWGLSTDAHSS